MTGQSSREIQVGPGVKPCSEILGNDGEIVACRLAEIHRGYVGYWLTWRGEEKVEGNSTSTELRDGEEGGDDGAAGGVVDENFPCRSRRRLRCVER